MADVYVLTSPAPTLWVYPSALHVGSEIPAPLFGGGPSRRAPTPSLNDAQLLRRKADEDALLVMGLL